MSWNRIGPARKAKGNEGTYKRAANDKRVAPARQYSAPPSFANYQKPVRAIVRRPDPDLPRLSQRNYTTPVLPGQGAATPTTLQGAANNNLPAGVGRTHVQAQGRTWKAFTIDLSVARVDQPIWLPGDLVWYFASTNATDQLSVRFIDTPGDQRSDPLPLHPGNAIGNNPFKGIAISNGIIAGATATIVITDSPAEVDGSE